MKIKLFNKCIITSKSILYQNDYNICIVLIEFKPYMFSEKKLGWTMDSLQITYTNHNIGSKTEK